MEIEVYGRAKVLSPHVEDDELRAVDDLESAGTLADFLYAGRSVRHLAVADTTLSGGRISRIQAQRVTFDRLTFHSVLFEDCALSSSDWLDCSLSRVKFRRCRFLGASFVDNKWSNVVFEDCRIGYATYESVQARGPVVFVGTRLKDVVLRRSELPGGHMSACTLDGVEFDGGNYGAFDLRGNDLSTIRGAASLNGALIDPIQRAELAEALVSELDLRYPHEDGQ